MQDSKYIGFDKKTSLKKEEEIIKIDNDEILEHDEI